MSNAHLNCELVKVNMFDNLQAQNHETFFTLLYESQLCFLCISTERFSQQVNSTRAQTTVTFTILTISQKKDSVALPRYCQTDVGPMQHA